MGLTHITKPMNSVPIEISVSAGCDRDGHQSKTNNTLIMAAKIRPLGDRVLVEPAEEKEQKKGGIIIPDSAKEKPTESIVVALGTGKVNDNGDKVAFEVKKGDRVLVS